MLSGVRMYPTRGISLRTSSSLSGPLSSSVCSRRSRSPSVDERFTTISTGPEPPRSMLTARAVNRSGPLCCTCPETLNDIASNAATALQIVRTLKDICSLPFGILQEVVHAPEGGIRHDGQEGRAGLAIPWLAAEKHPAGLRQRCRQLAAEVRMSDADECAGALAQRLAPQINRAVLGDHPVHVPA